MTQRTFGFIILAILLFTAPAWADSHDIDLTGEYAIKGWDPGNKATEEPDYEGVATIKKYGEAWIYHGVMDGQSYLGVGLFDKVSKRLSLSFTNMSKTENGVTLLDYRDGNLKGTWVFMGVADGMLGSEIWIKQ